MINWHRSVPILWIRNDDRYTIADGREGCRRERFGASTGVPDLCLAKWFLIQLNIYIYYSNLNVLYFQICIHMIVYVYIIYLYICLYLNAKYTKYTHIARHVII